jgi:hypothetical protein
MAAPKCPQCNVEIRWSQGLRAWNVWRYPCPSCKVELEFSPLVKALTVASVPAGIAIAGVAIYLERAGRWQTLDSLTFFAVVTGIGLAISAATWRRTIVKVKRNDA